MAQPTAILIITGAYFLPPAWNDFISRLKTAGFEVQCPRLPTCGDTSRPPTATLSDDASAVRTAAKSLLDAGHTILTIAHSYGGIVASQALTKDLYAESNPSDKGLVSLVLLSAWLLQPGDTFLSIFEKYGFQSKLDAGQNGDGTVSARNAVEAFYNDLEPGRAEELARENVTYNWAGVSTGMVTGTPWKDLPTVYVGCLVDLAVFVSLQRSMVLDAQNAGGRVVLEEIDSGHCPFLSRPEEVMEIVLRVARGD